MTELIIFILCSFGMTFIIVYGSIFDSIRPSKESGKLGELLNCPLCTGFWVGVFLWFISPWTSLFTSSSGLTDGFLLGCLSAGTSYILSSLIGDDGIQIRRQ